MLAALKQEDLIVSNSNVPLIRAGYANIIFLLLIIGLILIKQALSAFQIPAYVQWLLLSNYCLMILISYIHSISRISIKDKKTLVLTTPFSATKINNSEIDNAKVFAIPSSMTIILKIRRKTSALPEFYYFIAASTNYGSYADTRTKLVSLLTQFCSDGKSTGSS